MKFKGGPGQIAIVLRRTAHAMEAGAKAAESEAAKVAMEIAHDLSSGPITSRELRKLGHPYGHGRTPPADPAILNLQSGAFKAGWRIIGPRKSGDGLRTTLVNASPYAGHLLRGTRRMIPRPYERRLRDRLSAARERIWRAFLKGTFGP